MPGSLIVVRNALSFISRMGFQRRLSERETTVLLTKYLKKKRGCRARPEEIWDPGIILRFYREGQENEVMQIEELKIKCILLVCIFTVCRPGELTTIDMNRSVRTDKMWKLSIQLKTSMNRSYLKVRRLSEENRKICPFRLVDFLWKKARSEEGGVRTFLTNRDGSPMGREKLYRLLRKGLNTAGIPEGFKPYSIKHATISYLVQRGARTEDVANFARLSTTTATVYKHYFYSNKEEELTGILAEGGEESGRPDNDGEKVQDYLEL